MHVTQSLKRQRKRKPTIKIKGLPDHDLSMPGSGSSMWWASNSRKISKSNSAYLFHYEKDCIFLLSIEYIEIFSYFCLQLPKISPKKVPSELIITSFVQPAQSCEAGVEDFFIGAAHAQGP